VGVLIGMSFCAGAGPVTTGASAPPLLLSLNSDVYLHGFCLDANMALVVTLEYEVMEPVDTRVLALPSTAIPAGAERQRWIVAGVQVFLPFDGSTMALANRDPRDAFTGRSLELPLATPNTALHMVCPVCCPAGESVRVCLHACMCACVCVRPGVCEPGLCELLCASCVREGVWACLCVPS
jgi:hypothetical protein